MRSRSGSGITLTPCAGSCVKGSSLDTSSTNAADGASEPAKSNGSSPGQHQDDQMIPSSGVIPRPSRNEQTWRELRAAVWDCDADQGCYYRGKALHPIRNFVVDHVAPESKGGPTTLDNLVASCRPCNSAKSATARDIFLARRRRDRDSNERAEWESALRNLGTHLRERRQALGLSPIALSHRSGISDQTIHDLERGQRPNPKPETVQRVLSALGSDFIWSPRYD